MNLSLSSGKFPDGFKQAIVTPLLKKPTLDKELMSNYRPISNLSFLSKLLERLVHVRLSLYLCKNKLFNNFQSAYTKHRSTETTLLSLHNTIINAMSTQKITALCLLDLSAAFDTIDHNILLHRLSSYYGINSTALYWFESYLQNRRYRVKICNHLSSSEALDYGVPQGSVLGPVLFALYTTPLSSLISSYALDHHLYADDTQLFTCFTPSNSLDSISSIETAFNSISDWMTHNFLAINPSKTEFILIGTPSQLSKLQNPALTISPSISILPVSSVRNLGVIFDKHLSLHDHITKVYQTCFFHIRDLRRIRPCLTLATASTIGTALVQSKLD